MTQRGDSVNVLYNEHLIMNVRGLQSFNRRRLRFSWSQWVFDRWRQKRRFKVL